MDHGNKIEVKAVKTKAYSCVNLDNQLKNNFVPKLK